MKRRFVNASYAQICWELITDSCSKGIVLHVFFFFILIVLFDNILCCLHPNSKFDQSVHRLLPRLMVHISSWVMLSIRTLDYEILHPLWVIFRVVGFFYLWCLLLCNPCVRSQCFSNPSPQHTSVDAAPSCLCFELITCKDMPHLGTHHTPDWSTLLSTFGAPDSPSF